MVVYRQSGIGPGWSHVGGMQVLAVNNWISIYVGGDQEAYSELRGTASYGGSICAGVIWGHSATPGWTADYSEGTRLEGTYPTYDCVKWAEAKWYLDGDWTSRSTIEFHTGGISTCESF